MALGAEPAQRLQALQGDTGDEGVESVVDLPVGYAGGKVAAHLCAPLLRTDGALLEREEYAPLAVVAQIVGYVGEAETPERLDAVFAADVDDYAAEVEKKVARHRHVRGYSTVHVSPARIMSRRAEKPFLARTSATWADTSAS